MSDGRREYMDGWTKRTMAVALTNVGPEGLANCLRQSCEKFMGAERGEYVDDIYADALEVALEAGRKSGKKSMRGFAKARSESMEFLIRRNGIHPAKQIAAAIGALPLSAED